MRKTQAEIWAALPPVEQLWQRSELKRARAATTEPRAAGRPRSRRPAKRVATAPPRARARPSTHVLGASAEARAAARLERAGYTIVERNYRCEAGELDLVVRRGDTLVFVEVRSRASPDHGEAAEMVIRAKRRQVSHVAAAYLARERPRFRYARFDVVAVTGDDIVWLADAWRLGDRQLLAAR